MRRALPALFVGLLIGCGAPAREARPPTPGEPHLEVMTYNVNYGLAGDPEALELLAEGQADLVLLQETNAEWESAIRERLSGIYPYMDFRHCCGAGGLAILSKHPFDDGGYFEAPPGGWFPAWRLIVHGPLGDLQVLNVHLHPPISESGSVVSGYFSTPPVREAEITAHAAELDPALPTLVAGDFNEGESGRALEFLAERGFKSALPEQSDEPTWHWQTSVGSISMRLDHLVYDKRLDPLDVRVLQRGRSDHYPVLGTFELAD